MNPFTAADLASLRETQESAMMDTCIVERRTATLDAWGSEVETWNASAPLPCGFSPTSPSQRERRRADGTIAVIDATLRLRIEDGGTLDSRDRVRVTHRFGEPLPH